MRRVLLGLAVVLLVVSGLFFFQAMHINQAPPRPVAAPAPTAQAPAPLTRVLVANVDIPTGTFLKEDMVRWQKWPGEAVDPAYLVEGKADPKTVTSTGAVVRRPILAGLPITESQLVRPGDRGFLAAVLKPGMRAVSIAVNEISGLSGFIYPGDRVDLMLVHSVTNPATASAAANAQAAPQEKPPEHRVSETILENVRILAINQSLAHPAGQGPEVAHTMTIEVTPKQAEMLAVAVQLGQLMLTLRGLANAPEAPQAITDLMEIPEPDRGTTFTLDSDVSRATDNTPRVRPTPVVRAGPAQHRIEVNRGGKVEELVVN
jgi:pilus assembly protein CpaB